MGLRLGAMTLFGIACLILLPTASADDGDLVPGDPCGTPSIGTFPAVYFDLPAGVTDYGAKQIWYVVLSDAGEEKVKALYGELMCV